LGERLVRNPGGCQAMTTEIWRSGAVSSVSRAVAADVDWWELASISLLSGTGSLLVPVPLTTQPTAGASGADRVPGRG
jgi:hypothetical protein